jgi:benzoyl-CoA reductase/2-hydroxyglutaryl-CoA dehydratase subunit BcrC/BadD/HgdB
MKKTQDAKKGSAGRIKVEAQPGKKGGEKKTSTTQFMIVAELAGRLHMAVEGLKKKPGLMKSGVGYLQLVADYIDAVVNAKKDGKLVVIHGTQMPTEIFYAMDIVPLFNELYSVVLTMMGAPVRELYDLSAANGLPTEICAFNKSMDGLLLADVAPKFDLAAWHGSSCDNTPWCLQNVAKAQNIPTFFMDRPYKIFSEHTVAYWRKQHEELIAFLEQHSGKKMDYDRLKEAVDLSYRTTQLCLEIDRFSDMVPTPMSCEAAFGPFLAARQFGGHSKAVQYLEGLRDELKERVANGVQAANPERFRYIFDVSCPYFDMGLLELAQKKYGAVVVADHIARWRGTGEWFTDPDDPVGNLANKQQFNLGNENYQPGVEWRDQVLELTQKTKADAAIFWNNIGCRTGASMWRILKENLEKKLGVPSLTIDCDILDPTYTPRKVIEEQMDGFFEMVENSKSYKARRYLK